MRRQFSSTFKLGVVSEVLQSGLSCERIAIQNGLSHSMVERWVALYRERGAAGLERPYRNYDASFKLTVLDYLQEHRCSYQAAALHFDIRDSNSIAVWRRQYTLHGIAALSPRRRGRPVSRSKSKASPKASPRSMPKSPPSYEDLQKEVEYLRMENAFLKKLDALIRRETESKTKSE